VVSFFNELEIKKPCSKTVVSFFNEVAAETQKTILETSVSFFNEVASETQKLSSKPLFHFLTRLPQRHKNYHRVVLDHGFQEDKAPEGDHVKGQNSVMASKRSLLEGRNTLWKDTMSRVVTGVKRSGSNNPIKEITMSTTRSKSSEVEAMGNNAT
jgi:hypothetical protein